MIRLLAVLLVATAVIACSKSEEKPSPEAAAAAQALGLTPPAGEPAKPVPAELPDVVARVNGEAVTKAEFERAVQALEGNAGGAVPPDQRDRIYRGVLDQLIGVKLLAQEAAARKIVAADADVDARLAQIKSQFSSEAVFMQTLIERRLSVDEIKADARRDLVVNKMLQDEIGTKVAVTPEQVQDFYAKNPDRFKQGERVRASHILIPFPQGADDKAKGDARTKAEQVLKEVKAGGDFAALAKKYSQDPGSAPNGGDLGYFQRGQMVGPFNDAAFSLAPGVPSDLIETQFGFHIIKVAEKAAARDVPLDEVRPQVEQYLKTANEQQQTTAFVAALKAKGKIDILI